MLGSPPVHLAALDFQLVVERGVQLLISLNQ